MLLEKAIDTIISHNAEISVFLEGERQYIGMAWELKKSNSELLQKHLCPITSWYPYDDKDDNRGHLILEVTNKEPSPEYLEFIIDKPKLLNENQEIKAKLQQLETLNIGYIQNINRLEHDNKMLVNHMRELESHVKKLESQPSTWISVNDRLPNNGDLILIVYQNGIVCSMDYAGSFLSSVTHWAPLVLPDISTFGATKKDITNGPE